MKTNQITIAILSVAILFTACRKNEAVDKVETIKINERKLSKEEEVFLQRIKLSTIIISDVLKDNKIRKDLNNFILAKVKKTGTDEELTFKEIFSNKLVKLDGVNENFLINFKDKFIETIIRKDFSIYKDLSNLKFNNENEIQKYFGQKNVSNYILNSLPEKINNVSSQFIDELEFDPGFEIYFPYSENFENQNYLGNSYYAVTFNPLVNDFENEGEIYDNVTGQFLYVSLIDDDFAYGTPTYIVTIDDGLNFNDLNDNLLNYIKTPNYKVSISDLSYNPVTFQSSIQTNVNPPINGCTTELRIKDGKWGLIHNGYGLFEGAIEFAVAVSNEVAQVSIPNQNPDSNPILTLDASAFSYVKIKRKKVKKMRDDENEYVNVGMYISKWCPGDPDKMIFLYEYDKPWLLSENAKEFSELIGGSFSLIRDSSLRATVSLLPIAPVVKAVLEGTAKSRIEHYSIINSNAVNTNQRSPTSGINPSLLNGFRPYGKSSVYVTMVMD
jgi:hypothetical protein